MTNSTWTHHNVDWFTDVRVHWRVSWGSTSILRGSKILCLPLAMTILNYVR